MPLSQMLLEQRYQKRRVESSQNSKRTGVAAGVRLVVVPPPCVVITR